MKEITIDKILDILNANVVNTEFTKEQLDENLAELGMDSIAFIRVIVSLEEFECEVPDSKLIITEMNTINKMVEVLTSIELEITE